MSKKRSKALILLSVFIIGALATCFAIVPASATTEYVDYSFNLTAADPLCAFEGVVTYPSNALSVDTVTVYSASDSNGSSSSLYRDDENGTLKFNSTYTADVFDFSTSKAAVTVRFIVKGSYSSSDISGSVTDIYTAAQVKKEDTTRSSVAFDYANVVDGYAVSAGHKDLDNAASDSNLPKFKFAGASLSLKESISINFLVKKSLIDNNGFENLRVEVVDENNNSYPAITSPVVKNLAGTDYYAFKFDNVYPQLIGVTYSATLYGEREGVAFKSAVKDYSVLTYCNNQLPNADSKTKTLLVDLLNYGAACQAQLGIDSSKYVNRNLTSAQQGYATQNVPELENIKNNKYVQISNPEKKWLGATLSLENTIAYKMYVRDVTSVSDLDGIVMRAKVNNSSDDYDISVTEKGKDNTGVYFILRGVKPSLMGAPVDFTMTRNGTAISHTYRYSINSYLNLMLPSATGTTKDLMECIAKYGDSSYKFENS